MIHSHLALVIRPLEVWNIYAATLFHVEEYEFYFNTTGKVEVAEVSTHEALSKLVAMCAQCEPRAIYESFGKKKFKTEANFWAKADEPMQRLIKQMTDKRLKGIIEIAARLGIHLFFRENSKDELLKKNELSLSTIAVAPQMIFNRGNEGIEYSLRLKLNEEEVIVPCEHHPFVLSDTSGIFLLGNRIHTLPEGFSGKLLLPFLNKSSIFIPQRAQNSYFRQFILKNAYKTEIQAEGFDIVEEQCEQKCRILLEKDIQAEAVFNIQFVYGDVVFDGNDKRKLYIRLEEAGESFRFIKFTRNQSWEQEQRRILKEAFDMPERGSLATLIEWLKTHTTDLRESGIEFHQPSKGKYYLGDARISQSTQWKNDWLQLHIEIHLDNGTVIPFLKLKDAILSGEHEYLLKDGSIFLIPDEWFARYGGVMMFGRAEEEHISVHRCQLPVTTAICTGIKEEAPDDLSTPLKLKTQLRHYQQKGFEWLYRHFAAQTGCCLSDDMGLGKTVQTIALLLKYKETCRHDELSAASVNNESSLFSTDEMQGAAAEESGCETDMPFRTILVVSPASVVYNWRNELHRFAPQLTVCEYTGTTEERRRKQQALMRWDVVLTTYQTLRNDIEYLSHLTFGILVFDESQSFKNRNSQLYRSVVRLQAYHRIALSGTPIENSLSDLWSLMNLLNPTLLGSHQAFQRNYIHPISQKMQDKKAEILRTLVAPYFLKRSKEDVLTDLPARLDELVMCEMTAEQQRLYDKELSCARNLVLSDHPEIGGASPHDASATSVHVLTAINRLRQIACHPRLIGEEPMESGKFNELFARLETLHETDHKVLLFSEYVSFLRLVADEMQKRHWTYEILTGETVNREAVINRFSDTPSCHFFLISLKAGGVGLNLTSADYVFMLDPWWNRAAEEQAISRAHRMGQRRSVFVYRFISCGTLEEDILNLQDRKQSLVEAVLPFIDKAADVCY